MVEPLRGPSCRGANGGGTCCSGYFIRNHRDKRLFVFICVAKCVNVDGLTERIVCTGVTSLALRQRWRLAHIAVCPS